MFSDSFFVPAKSFSDRSMYRFWGTKTDLGTTKAELGGSKCVFVSIRLIFVGWLAGAGLGGRDGHAKPRGISNTDAARFYMV